MLAECSRCQEPIYEYMPRCAQCGQPNVNYVDDQRPTAAATDDQKAEALLLVVGALSVANSFSLFLLKTAANVVVANMARVAWLPALLLGLASLIVYHRIDVTSLTSGAKGWLWGVLYVVGAITLMSYWLVMNGERL